MEIASELIELEFENVLVWRQLRSSYEKFKSISSNQEGWLDWKPKFSSKFKKENEDAIKSFDSVIKREHSRRIGQRILRYSCSTMVVARPSFRLG